MYQSWCYGILRIGALAGFMFQFIGSAAVRAQNWPARPVQVVVSSGAGGTADIIARLVGDRLSSSMGQPFVIANMPGAGGVVGMEKVARSSPDGYTLLVSGSPTHAIGPHLYKLAFEPLQEVPPVAMLGFAPNLLVVNPKLPVKTLSEFVAFAKSKREGVTFASAGFGTTGHLAGEMLKLTERIDATHVPFKSGQEAVAAVMAGSVDICFFTVPATLPQVQAGHLRALAITSAERSPLAPDIPTALEVGYPDFEIVGWFALLVPKGLPAELSLKLENEVKHMLAQKDVLERFNNLGLDARFLAAGDALAFAKKDAARWGHIIKSANIKVE